MTSLNQCGLVAMGLEGAIRSALDAEGDIEQIIGEDSPAASESHNCASQRFSAAVAEIKKRTAGTHSCDLAPEVRRLLIKGGHVS